MQLFTFQLFFIVLASVLGGKTAVCGDTIYSKLNPQITNHGDIRQSDTCNGILTGPAGVINYKLRVPYVAHERCIWTVQVGNYKSVRIRLLENGLAGNYLADAVSIYTVDVPNLFAYGKDRIIKAGAVDNRTTEVTVSGPLIYLFFHTDGSSHGTGFSLLYEGIGASYNSSEFCSELNQQDPVSNRTGIVSYNKANLGCQRKIYSIVFPVRYPTPFPISIYNFNKGDSHVTYSSDRELSVYLLETYRILLRGRYGHSDIGPFTTRSPYPLIVLFETKVWNTNQSFIVQWG